MIQASPEREEDVRVAAMNMNMRAAIVIAMSIIARVAKGAGLKVTSERHPVTGSTVKAQSAAISSRAKAI